MNKMDYLHEADRYIIKAHIDDTLCIYRAMEQTFAELGIPDFPRYSSFIRNDEGSHLGGNVTTGNITMSIACTISPQQLALFKGTLSEALHDLCIEDCQFIVIDEMSYENGTLTLVFFCFVYLASMEYFFEHSQKEYEEYSKGMLSYRQMNLMEAIQLGELPPLKYS